MTEPEVFKTRKLSVRLAVWSHERGYLKLNRAIAKWWQFRNWVRWDVWLPIEMRIRRPFRRLRAAVRGCKIHKMGYRGIPGIYRYCFGCLFDDAMRRHRVKELGGKQA